MVALRYWESIGAQCKNWLFRASLCDKLCMNVSNTEVARNEQHTSLRGRTYSVTRVTRRLRAGAAITGDSERDSAQNRPTHFNQ